MTEAKHTLDESAMVRVGRRLQDARLAMGYSSGGIAPSLMAARTQIEDLEAGRMGTFYSAHYYLSLFRRYASFLKFSPEAVAAMVRELKGEAEPAPPAAVAEAPGPEPEPTPAPEPESTPAPPPTPLPAPEPQPAPPSEPVAAPPPSPRPAGPKSSGLGDRLLALLALVAVAAVAWVLLSEQQAPQRAVGPVQSSLVSPPAAPPEPAPPAPPPAQASPPPAEARPVPAEARPVPAEAVPDTDALVLRFPEKSWIWVRRADDSVSEVVIAAGSTLRFPEMPIYMVLPRPAEIQVTVRGRTARLARNDNERDMGRFTRTMLEEAAAR